VSLAASETTRPPGRWTAHVEVVRHAAARHETLLGAAAVTAIALAAYLLHLLGDVGFWDTGAFQAAAPTLGLVHPTGYPTYLLLGWLFTTLVPLGNAALEMNLLGALSGALAVGAVHVLARELRSGTIVAAAAALTFGLTAAFWRTSIRADPHPLHVLLALAVILLLLEWHGRGHPYRLLAIATALYGLSLGNHLLAAVLAPALGAFVLAAEPGIVRRIRRLAGLALALLAGAAVYLYIPLRAAAGPAIHHDYAPTTWDLFWRYVLGRDFGSGMGFLTTDGPAIAAGRFGAFFNSLVDGSSLAVAVGLLLLGLGGLVVVARRDWRIALLLGLAGGLTLYAALTYVNADIERYYFLPLALLAALAACGAQALLDRAAAAQPEMATAGVALLLVPAALAWTNADHATARTARCYADATLAAVAPRAIVMSWWSYATPLWYALHVDGERPDVEVVLGDATIPAELERRFPDGRPIYLIQHEAQLEEIRRRYLLEPVKACGETLQRVVGPRPGELTKRARADEPRTGARAGTTPTGRLL